MKAKLTWLMCMLSGVVFAQHHQEQHTEKEELKTVKDFFTKGHFNGHIRNYSMATINEGELKDYWANAIGAGLDFHTAEWKGISLGLKGIFIYRIASNDLNEKDQIAGASSRFEKQLFDLEHPENYTDLDRLEELFIQYRNKKWTIQFGKIEVKTPIVQLHDGRMKPKVFTGFWSQLNDWKHLDIYFGWMYQSSPRSTTHWYNIKDAIGIYNNGYLEDGTKANYHHHLKSSGLGIAGLKYHKKHHKIQLWNYYLDNMVNTTMVQYDYTHQWIFGVLYLNQLPVSNGGSKVVQHRYYKTTETTHVGSARLGYQLGNYSLTLNGTYVGETGRYIFPREFSFDPFYTSITRNWVEGLGDAKVAGIQLKYKKKHFKWMMGWVRTYVASDQNLFKLNKYGQLSYDQLNIDATYSFSQIAKGVEVRGLYVYAPSHKRTNIDSRLAFNRVNYHQFNLILNLKF